MNQAELTSYLVQIRTKLDDGTYTAKDAFRTLWETDNPLSHEQKQEIHQALELPFEVPGELELILHVPVAEESA